MSICNQYNDLSDDIRSLNSRFEFYVLANDSCKLLQNWYAFLAHAGGRLRHAFIGMGFRERPQAYDFQAALHDHMK